eukprot:TRINITY_DN1245_c0_g1_i1.p1 TRINITY_DN1245_c0_g1~~TRINITY_DN1245_c0_g1_i1.p1  ORF type:complete len:948 (+),score=72.74 TRINITY_DN1245_c0_g1_i1:10012-12855(+)
MLRLFQKWLQQDWRVRQQSNYPQPYPYSYFLPTNLPPPITVLYLQHLQTFTIDGVMEAVLPVFSTALKQTESLPNFGVVLACMSNTLILFSSHPELIKPLVDLLSLIDPPILNTLAQLIALTKTVAENGGEKFSSTASEMLRQITTLTIWAEMSMEIFERGVKHNPQVGTYFIGSTGLANILIQSVQVVACVGSQQPESLLSSTGSNEFDTALNSLKEKCLEIGNSVLEHIHSTPASGKMPHLPLYSYCLTICPKAILTLAVVCVKEYDKLEERVTEETTSKVVVRLLRLLSDLVEDNNFYNTFNLNKHNIIIDIALVLLRTTQKEMKSIKTDPQNFVNLAIDTCEKQESETPKTEAAKLLEALCDHIDGCLSFTSIFCCESIKYACAGCNPEILVNFPMLSQFRNTSVFLSKSTPELIIETSIVVMADISYLTPKRKDIFAMFENALAENCVTLFDSSSILIKCRLALMMGYYADNLFTGKMDLFVKMIEFLLQGISMENEVKVLALQCADTLKTAIGDSDLVSRLDAFINKLFPTLCAMVGHIELPSFYEILMTIIGCYASSIDESLINLLQSLVSRVEKEYKDLRAKGERNNMTINQCWNVIRAISEQKAFFPAYLDSIEAALLPMFNYLVDPTHVEFDDDMIQVITALITRRGGISDNMAKIFPYLPNFFEKYGQTFGSLFQTLNAYIFYGKDVFAANKAWIELIIKLSVSSLFTTKETVTLNNTEGAILAQVLLQSIGNGVLDLYIPIILEQVVKRLNMPPSADYLSRELYNAILCSVCNNAQVTLGKLEALGSTETVFSGLFENAGKYQATYDVKVLVIGLSNLLIQSSLPPYLTSAQPKILDAIVSTLQRQAAKDAKTLLKADKKALALDQEDESENSSSEDEMEDNEEDEEYTFLPITTLIQEGRRTQRRRLRRGRHAQECTRGYKHDTQYLARANKEN